MAILPAFLTNRIKEQKIIRELHPERFTGDIFLVGGAIRELILDKSPRDYDFALSDEKDIQTFEKTFKTASFLLGKKPIQTYRMAAKDALIDITILQGSVEDDLKRRDFTINSIAYDVKRGKVIDTVGGIQDIEQKTIRLPDKESITNDPLRMLKAIRHYTVLQDFTFDPALKESVQEQRDLLAGVAPERIKYEMDLIITSENVSAGMRELEQLGLLFVIFPELKALKQMDEEKGFTLETFGHTLDGFTYLHKYAKRYRLDERDLKNTGYALLFHDLGKAHTFSYDETKDAVHFFYHEKFSREIAQHIMERLKFSTQEIKAILALIENHMRIFLISNDESTEKATRRVVYKMGELTPSLMVLTLCDMYGSSGGKNNASTSLVKKRCAEIVEVFNEWKRKPLPKLITGSDLLLIGFSEGPLIGKCLNEIREKQIAGDITTRAEAMEYARDFFKH